MQEKVGLYMYTFFKVQKRQAIVFFLSLLLISGCGQYLSSKPLQKQPNSVNLGNVTPTIPVSKPAPLGTRVAFDLGGWIHIQSESGFTCDAGAMTPPGPLVLPTVRPTYDQGTLQSLQNYLSLLYKNPGDTSDPHSDLPHHRNTVPYPPFSANPGAFQLVPVSANGDCDEFMQITNLRKTSIQITLASVTLTADSQRNTQHYNLVEGCSLLSLAPGCEGSIGGGGGIYNIKFDLHPGKKNTIIPASTIGNLNNNTFMLQQGEVAEVILTYNSSSLNNFSFSLMPSFTIGLPGGQPTTYLAPQLQETFAFARRSQFSCYSLQGQQFIKVSKSSGAWCI
jgi:hypothetical protein